MHHINCHYVGHSTKLAFSWHSFPLTLVTVGSFAVSVISLAATCLTTRCHPTLVAIAIASFIASLLLTLAGNLGIPHHAFAAPDHINLPAPAPTNMSLVDIAGEEHDASGAVIVLIVVVLAVITLLLAWLWMRNAERKRAQMMAGMAAAAGMGGNIPGAFAHNLAAGAHNMLPSAQYNVASGLVSLNHPALPPPIPSAPPPPPAYSHTPAANPVSDLAAALAFLREDRDRDHRVRDRLAQ